MSPQMYVEAFVYTLAVPWLIVTVGLLAWSLSRREPLRVRARTAIIGALWSTAVAVGINFVWLDLPYRIFFYLVITIVGVAVGRALDDAAGANR